MNTWVIEQNDFQSESVNKHMESLFTLGNGYLGVRGDAILPDYVFQRGTYINGFYESGPITYGEKAFGYAENWQTIIPIPEGKVINIQINGVKLFNHKGCFKEQRRILNLKESNSVWEFIWVDEKGLEYKGSVKTIIPFDLNGTVVFYWNIELPDMNSQILIESPLVMKIDKKPDDDDPRLPGHFNGSTLDIWKNIHDTPSKSLSVNATGSDLLLNCSMCNEILGIKDKKNEFEEIQNGYVEHISGRVGKNISIIKSITYSYGVSSDYEEIEQSVKDELLKFSKIGIEKIIANQNTFMERFWYNSDIQIKGDSEAQLSIRFNLFQLLQSTGRDGKRSIAAKGLSGSGYEGHYFWDAETYVLPFFIYTNPDIARSMLTYRISILKKAKERAELLGHQGALFPWRTINGDESSAYFPAGTAQYHINADIALGLSKYLEVTGDLSILEEGGNQLLCETARFWCDLGTFVKNKGFCFHSVTGPDEYTAMVDNNYYTNLSARENLKAAVKWLKDFTTDEEINEWKKKSASIYLPDNGNVTPQDDNFLNKEVWDFQNTDDWQYPLLLNYHPLNIYRKQVLKQADVVMAQSLFPSELPMEQMKINFDYYEQITTRDSSLSACAQGINAFWLGYDNLAWEYFNETLHTDRKDLHKNVFHGLHTASMGGSYLMVINGFLGLDHFDNTIKLNPRLPEKLTELNIKLNIGKSILHISVNQNDVTYSTESDAISFYHINEKINLKKQDKLTLPIHTIEKHEFQLFRPRK